MFGNSYLRNEIMELSKKMDRLEERLYHIESIVGEIYFDKWRISKGREIEEEIKERSRLQVTGFERVSNEQN